MNTMKTSTIILRLFTAALLALSAWSCSKEEGVDPVRETPPSGNTSGAYSFAIGGGHLTDENGTTRAILDVDGSGAVRTYTYSWSPAPDNDEVGLIITPENTTVPLPGAEHIRMTATNTQKAANAVFKSPTGEMTQNLFNTLSFEQSTQRYYSYYPYNASMSMSTFPVVQFRIPSALELTPNVLNPAYAPMVAAPLSDSRSVVFGEGHIPTLGSDSLLQFTYEHVFAYVALELDVSLLGTTPTPITSIEMESVDMLLCGDYGYNMATNTRQSTGYTNGSFRITINIPGGLRPGGGDVVYVPIPAEAGANAFVFNFRFPGTSYQDINGVPGINFDRGNIHRLRLAPPVRYAQSSQFTVTTSGYYYVEAWGGNGGKGTSIGSRSGGTGGIGATVRGLYQFTEGDVISVQVGGAGKDASGMSRGDAGTGSYGLGNGGYGGSGFDGGHTDGAAGGGGGAASGVARNGTAVVVAGGGGGGGGGSGSNLSGNGGGNGGGGGSVNANGGGGGSPNNTRDGGGGSGSGTGGVIGDGNSNGGTGMTAGGNNSGPNGGNGGNGSNSPAGSASGGGGGGGGGGYIRGGGGGGGGNNGAAFSASGAGGGGAGGASYSSGAVTYPNPDPGNGRGIIPASKTRPSTAGHVIITYVR